MQTQVEAAIGPLARLQTGPSGVSHKKLTEKTPNYRRPSGMFEIFDNKKVSFIKYYFILAGVPSRSVAGASRACVSFAPTWQGTRRAYAFAHTRDGQQSSPLLTRLVWRRGQAELSRPVSAALAFFTFWNGIHY